MLTASNETLLTSNLDSVSIKIQVTLQLGWTVLSNSYCYQLQPWMLKAWHKLTILTKSLSLNLVHWCYTALYYFRLNCTRAIVLLPFCNKDHFWNYSLQAARIHFANDMACMCTVLKTERRPFAFMHCYMCQVVYCYGWRFTGSMGLPGTTIELLWSTAIEVVLSYS